MPDCYSNSGGYLRLSDGLERAFSMLLAAYMAKKPVSVYYVFNNTYPDYHGWGKCHIVAVDLK